MARAWDALQLYIFCSTFAPPRPQPAPPCPLQTGKTVSTPPLARRPRAATSLITMLPMVRRIPHVSSVPILTVVVTDEPPRDHQHAAYSAKHVIKVQPLKKDEMQPSYAQDMGVGGVTHGFYGSMKQTLGSCIGFCGAIPCCPFPNPFKEVRQGRFL